MELARPIDNDFAEWAFGQDTWIRYLMWDNDCNDLFDAWNKLHGDLLILQPDDLIKDSLKQMKQFYKERPMDKKMHKVTEKMKMAEKEIAKGEPKKAAKTLKGAEKKNEKLVKIDRDVRDPMIDKCKKEMKGKKEMK